MKIIIVDEQHGDTRSLVLRGWARVGLTVCLLGLPIVLGYLGYQLAMTRGDVYGEEASLAWRGRLQQQESEVEQVKADAQAQLQALTLRVATLQAQLLRLDALGERLTEVAGLDSAEFDFNNKPALGGPESADASVPQTPDFLQALENLTLQIQNRQQQLDILDTLLFERNVESNTYISGRPVNRGWISSPYGRRIDPFTGNIAWHQGVDFATGEVGQDVVAVASGVVTFSGERSGYGMLVEINHGNGYETLYAHSQELLVNAGDIVKKGQVVALSGSSGRSTGPHVHFEVHKNGRVIDPASYIHRTSR